MFDFSNVREVQLAHGSHASPSEGMCFMEMVAWFAGEDHSDKPACACPVLGRYGIGLNDRMPDNLRDELLKPLVPMIAGTRGTLDDQRRRATFLGLWSVNKILAALMRARKREDLACQCEAASNLTEAAAVARSIKGVFAAAAAAYAYAADAADAYADAAADAADAADAAADAADAADAAAADAADAAADAADAADARRAMFALAVEGLRQAILIGPHEGFDVIIDLRARHDALAQLVAA